MGSMGGYSGEIYRGSMLQGLAAKQGRMNSTVYLAGNRERLGDRAVA